MIVGIPKEHAAGECRVAGTPQSVKKLIELGYEVRVQSGAGQAANLPDSLYQQAGAAVVDDADSIWSECEVVLTVGPVWAVQIERMKAGSILIGFLWPARNEQLLAALSRAQVTALAMDCVPRISRAQSMDALSSMANIAGYRAIVEAANRFGSFFAGQITAAGKVPPAKVLVIGAGVAGLAAIGAAKGLGAIVRAFDTRAAVKDQVKSMGAQFLELQFEESGEGAGGYAKVMSEEFIKAEMELFAAQAKEVDIIVTTALIPGKAAPKLITEEMVQSMKPGSVVVDLAAEQGGNCELTEPEQVVVRRGVTIVGYTDFPSRLPTQSSMLYSNNLVNLLKEMTPSPGGQCQIDMNNVIVRGALVTHQGEVTWPATELEPSPLPAPRSETASTAILSSQQPQILWGDRLRLMLAAGVVGALLLFLVGQFAPSEFRAHFTVFVLAVFIGWQVIWNVTPALHTPLMSVTNAISGIIVIGAMLQMKMGTAWFATALASVAALIATINVCGGFLVTQRMLGMFRRQA